MVPWSLCAAVSLVPCKSYLMRREQGCPNAALRTHLRPAAFALLMTQTPEGTKPFAFGAALGAGGRAPSHFSHGGGVPSSHQELLSWGL